MIPRSIRSFVCRDGRLTTSQQRALDELYPQFGILFSDNLLNFSEIFSRVAPQVLEIGFGNGKTLLQMAAEHPENNYLGIEVYRAGVGSLLLGIEREALTNLRVICADAVEVLTKMIPDESLAKIQIFFPDPWPKKRHHKRRLIQKEFVALLYQKLKPGGVVHLATDWQDYAEHMHAVFSENPNFKLSEHHERPTTKFEQRGQRLGYDIWDFVFQK